MLRLFDALPNALAGEGPALAPLPTVSVMTPIDVVQRMLDAIRPEDPDAPLEAEDIAVVLATSGSTGAPRGVLHTAASLQALDDAVLAQARAQARGDLAADAPVQWVAALPVTSMGGFNVLIRSIAAGTTPVCVPSIGGLSPFTVEGFAAVVHEQAHRAPAAALATSLVAAQVRRLLADPRGCDALRAFALVLVGGGPLPEPVQRVAVQAGVTLTTTYGSTETGGGCVFDGQPLPSVVVGLAQADGRIERGPEGGSPEGGSPEGGSPERAVTGEIVVSGPMLARGYRCDPIATTRAFTANGYRTGDIGQWSPSGLLRVRGRADDVISVRGTNVALGAVEEVVDRLPAVTSAAAVPTGPLDDPSIAVFVVTSDRDDVARAQTQALIRAQIGEHLGSAAVPAQVRIVRELPTLPGGKVDRARLRQESSASRAPAGQSTAGQGS